MSKRNEMGRFAKAPSKKMFIGSWIAAILGGAFAYAVARVVWSNFGSFRSCKGNNEMMITDCGKQGLHLGDLILLGLFLLAIFMALSLGTHAYRISRRMFS